MRGTLPHQVSGMDPEASDEGSLVGRVIQDRFRILRRIGAGGMGAVYLAEQLPLGRKVALKVLEPASENVGGAKLSFQERFLLEAAAVAKLAHPNTIILYDYGRTEEGRYYYAMELVEGSTLSQTIRERTYIDPAHVIHIGAQICGSLRDAHEAGLVHRDLKPGNIMLTRRGDDTWFVKVLDFGLVKQINADGAQELTRSGIVLGSPRYMAPEQIESRSVDHRADIYAFGVVMYHMLAGQPPFVYASQFETLRAQVDEKPPPIEARNPWCDAGPKLRELVYKCLEKHPDARPQSMSEISRTLRACAAEIGISLSSMSAIDINLDSHASGGVRLSQQPRVSLDPPTVNAKPQVLPQTVERPVMQPPPPAPAPEPAPVVAPPPPERAGGSGIWIGLALFLVVTLIGLGVTGAYVGGVFDRDPPRAPIVRPITPEPVDPEPPVVEPPAATSIELITEPPGAHVQHEGEDLGDAPLMLPIPAGERWRLTVTLEGHEPRTITVASGQTGVRVRLTPVAVAPPVEEPERPRVIVRPPPQQPPPQQPFNTQSQQQPSWGTQQSPRSENRNPWGP
jgi:serine/threonine protein kinase